MTPIQVLGGSDRIPGPGAHYCTSPALPEVRVAGPIKVGRAESRATVITDAWTPWDAYTDVLR